MRGVILRTDTRSPAQNLLALSLAMRAFVVGAYVIGSMGCSSHPQTTTLPKSRPDPRQVVEIDVGVVGDNAVDPAVPALQELKIGTNQKLLIRGQFLPADEKQEVPVFAYLHTATSSNPDVIAQGAVSHELDREGDMFRFAVDIGSPTSAGGAFRLVLKAGGERVIGTGTVDIIP